MTSSRKRTEIKAEFLGIAADNSFIANISSPRAVMHFSHTSSRVSLINPDKKLIMTGIESELGKYINDVRTEKDVIVKAVVAKRRDLGAYNPETTLLVEYQEDGKLWLDMIIVPTHRSSHGFFGYSLHPTDALSDITYNAAIPEGTVLAKTDSLADDGTYKFGISANVALMSHPSVAEDGFVVSESFLDKARFTSVTKRVIYLTKDNFPLNLYGDNDNFKMFPDIGTPVRPDGLLCATRDRNDWFSIADMNNESISEVDYTFDIPVYVPPNSIVVDVNVLRGNYQKSEYSPAMTTQLDAEASYLVQYYSNIVLQYEKILLEYKKMYGPDFKVEETPRLGRYIADCMIKRDSVTSKNKLCYRKINIDQYRVEITCMSVVRPNHGYKLTDQHASKGVICKVMKDEDMPVDAFGNRADVIADAGSSTISRMNIGRLYEHYLGAASRDNQQRLIAYYCNKYGPNFLSAYQRNALLLDADDIQYAVKHLHGLYSLINSDMTRFLEELDEEGLDEHLRECLLDAIYFYYPTDNEINIIDVIKSFESSIYKPNLGKVTYRDELGKITTTKDDIRIGKMYIHVLDKVADYSAVSSAKVNSFNFPIKGGQADRHKYPHSLTPTTTMSETEVRILSSFADPVLLAELLDLALNPVSHKLLIRNILETQEAFSTDYDIDREIDEYGNTKSLALLKHVFAAAGFTFEHSPQD